MSTRPMLMGVSLAALMLPFSSFAMDAPVSDNQELVNSLDSLSLLQKPSSQELCACYFFYNTFRAIKDGRLTRETLDILEKSKDKKPLFNKLYSYFNPDIDLSIDASDMALLYSAMLDGNNPFVSYFIDNKATSGWNNLIWNARKDLIPNFQFLIAAARGGNSTMFTLMLDNYFPKYFKGYNKENNLRADTARYEWIYSGGDGEYAGGAIGITTNYGTHRERAEAKLICAAIEGGNNDILAQVIGVIPLSSIVDLSSKQAIVEAAASSGSLELFNAVIAEYPLSELASDLQNGVDFFDEQFGYAEFAIIRAAMKGRNQEIISLVVAAYPGHDLLNMTIY